MLKQYKYLLFNIFFVFASMQLFCEVRYVSKTAGLNSAPPYTSWATACDSLQKCFDYCLSGDTVYIDRGIYKETIYIYNKDLTIIGLDTDECILDGTGIEGKKSKYILCYFEKSNIKISNIMFKKNEPDLLHNYYAIFYLNGKCTINTSIIDSTRCGLRIDKGGDVNNVIIKNTYKGIILSPYYDNSILVINNNIIHALTEDTFPQGIYSGQWGGIITISNNIILTKPNSNNYYGIEICSNRKVVISNNLIYGFGNNIYIYTTATNLGDTTFVTNNTLLKSISSSIMASNFVENPKKYIIKNNILAHNGRGIAAYFHTEESDYNMLYNTTGEQYTNISVGDHDKIADPMFVKDTAADLGSDYDYKLQKFSPAIDAGDPDILDIDGSRSDMGMYGGPLGAKYIYTDLAPKPLKNLNALYEQDSNRVKLTWTKSTEADFAKYYVYKDINANFIIDSTKRIGILTDTLFYDILNKGTQKVYYKVTAIDNTGNESRPETEVNVTITKNEEVLITENLEYALYQNYPNPFNPNTTISYSLKEQGEVRIKLYTITGELIKTLIEGAKSKGYYETKIDMMGYTSGIYLYRLEVTGAGKIPKFSDLKKMIFLK
ncbi:MAG: T9SS type A sorting domain-containing protein [bacterium]